MLWRNCTDQPTSGLSYKFSSQSSWLCTALRLPTTPPPTAPQESQTNPTGTMQSAEAKFNRSSLLLALRRYSTTVNDMEHTILLPSLLRDVPADEIWDCEAAEGSCKDLYENYLMLKAIRNTVESGLVHLDDCKAKNNTAMNNTLEPLLETDPEALFHFHLSGLFSVMNNLTEKTRSLTDKYMEIIGEAN